MATIIKVDGTTIKVQNKSNESSAPVAIDLNQKSTENTTLTFPTLASGETGKGKAFSSINDAMSSSILRSLVKECKGWISRQEKYKIATRQEAEENKQAIFNKAFTYDRKYASSKSRELQYATKDGILLVLFINGAGTYDFINVFCPVVNTHNNKVIFKNCGHFWVSNNSTTEKTYDSLILAQESFIDSLLKDIEA